MKRGVRIRAAHVDRIERDEGVIWAIASIDLSKLSGKAKRINITLPEAILSKVDQFAMQQGDWSEAVMEKIEKFCSRVEDYALSYEHQGCHRTSNLVDRLMNRLTRYLYDNRGIHGHLTSSERRLRGWALLQNFRPFAPRSGMDRPYQSPAHRLNQKQYHEH